MLFVYLIFSFTKTLEEEEDKDNIMEYFLGKDIKIFLAGYSHIHLAENSSKENGDFIGVSKYLGASKFKYNDRAKITRDGEKYAIQLGDSKMCIKDKKRLIKCGDEEEPASFNIKRSNHGFLIQNNKTCITKSDFFEIKLLDCASGDDQLFDFKNIIDENRCDELRDKQNNEKKERLKEKEAGNLENIQSINSNAQQSMSQNLQDFNENEKYNQNQPNFNPQYNQNQPNFNPQYTRNVNRSLNTLQDTRSSPDPSSNLYTGSATVPIFIKPAYIEGQVLQRSPEPSEPTLIHINNTPTSITTQPIADISEIDVSNKQKPSGYVKDEDQNNKYENQKILYSTPYGYAPYWKKVNIRPDFPPEYLFEEEQRKKRTNVQF